MLVSAIPHFIKNLYHGPKSLCNLFPCSLFCHTGFFATSLTCRTYSCFKSFTFAVSSTWWNTLSPEHAGLPDFTNVCLNAATPETLQLKKFPSGICSHSITLHDLALLYFSKLTLCIYFFTCLLPIPPLKYKLLESGDLAPHVHYNVSSP